MKKNNVMDTLRNRIREHKYKFTNQRQIILQAFLDSSEKHLSAEDIYAAVKDREPELGLATVYRSLELFTTLELLKKLDFGDGRSRYELNDRLPEHSHHHLLCLSCGKVEDFTCDGLAAMQKKIAVKKGFRVVDSQLKIYGYCEACRKERGE